MVTEVGLIEIIISSDSLRAWARVNPDSDAKSYAESKLLATLSAQSIEVTEAMRERLRELFERLGRGDVPTEDVLLAEGVGPVPGQDGVLRWTPQCDPNLQRVQENHDGASEVDHYARSSIISVGAGDLICTVIPPTVGTPGRNIYGREVPARTGHRAPMHFAETIAPDANDSTRLVARIGGRLNVVGHEAWVSPLLMINRDVDFQVGNIDFDGSVTVRGNVLDLFRLRASKDVVVHGLVEGAKVECSGDLTVVGGIAGKQKAVISVGGTLRARFIDNATVTAKGEVIVQRELVNSKVSTEGRVQTAGAITACTIEACTGIQATTIGSKSGVRTILAVGNSTELLRRWNRVGRDAAALEEGIAQNRARLEPLLQRQNSLPETYRAMVTKLLSQVKEDNARLALLKKEKEQLQQATKENRSACVKVAHLIHEGTTVQIGKATTTLRQSLRGPLRLISHPTAEGERIGACSNQGGMVLLE
jgi:hypothetical protein